MTTTSEKEVLALFLAEAVRSLPPDQIDVAREMLELLPTPQRDLFVQVLIERYEAWVLLDSLGR